MTIFRLGLMMFLQFFVWGAWFVSVGKYLDAGVGRDDLIGGTYAVSYLAAAVAPLFFSFLADRFFPAQVVLGVLHIVGAGVLYWITTADVSSIVSLTFVYMCCYAPTLGLTNAIAFNSITDPDKQFPIIRVNGTIGWIAAGLVVSFVLKAEESLAQFHLAAAASLVLGLYSFTLPNTPSADRGTPFSFSKLLALDAFTLLKDRQFTVFIIFSTLIALPLSLYYSYANVFVDATGVPYSTAVMGIGQVSEVAFMVAMPIFLARLGVKWMLLVGMVAWVLRYTLFGFAVPGNVAWMVILSIVLHGICYDFFFVTGQLYVDKKAPKAIRNQAQGLFVLAIYGVGMTAGNIIGGSYFERLKLAEDAAYAVDWRTFWLGPAGFALVTAIVFAMLFRNPKLSVDDVAELDSAGEILADVDEPKAP